MTIGQLHTQIFLPQIMPNEARLGRLFFGMTAKYNSCPTLFLKMVNMQLP